MTKQKNQVRNNLSQSPKSQKSSLDKWAKWLLYQRFQDRPSEERAKAIKLLESIRDQVLDDAQLQVGQRVLDLGAGTGLLTLGALERVTSDGSVVSIDISADSLHACKHDTELIGATVNFVIANGLTLPFQTNTFNAVVIRSVLIYITNKFQTLAECYRVLNNGGMLSLFEPINRDRTPNIDFSKLPEKIRNYVTREKQDLLDKNDPMLDFGFDELVHYAETAGFTDVQIKKDIVKEELPDVEAIDRYFLRVPAPGRLSPSEYYRYHLGDAGFDAYRRYWINALEKGPVYIQTPTVFLSAQKS
ncbi:MAG: hypothetical protein BroJett015_32490 [Chloroflexota bacterium]|nr:methyltransferase domain-containing protein [Ardenticatenaceae bacterium]GIK57586.1 MAG: hypothetical protein BroJett015_32490 [Chloroflexota bacterium]